MRGGKLRFLILGTFFCGAALPSFAIHHLMQISRIVPDVYGDTSAQAIELRMRSAGQNVMSGSRLYVYDAAGANPILIFDFNSSVTNGSAGDTVLLTTDAFNAYTSPDTQPDFTMTNRIPDSYFPAGRLTFEEDDGTVLWSVAWGGSNYTGSNAGAVTNDDDGDFGPPISGALSSPLLPIIKLLIGSAAASTTNASNYGGVTSDLLTNNARESFGLDLRERKITVKRPKSSDVLQAGDSVKIKWVTEGTLGDKVRIDLFDNGTKVDTIKKKSPNSGKHKWNIPGDTPAGSNYQVRVQDRDTGTSDLSQEFSITGN